MGRDRRNREEREDEEREKEVEEREWSANLSIVARKAKQSYALIAQRKRKINRKLDSSLIQIQKRNVM